jgi:signal transduction histidine kinase
MIQVLKQSLLDYARQRFAPRSADEACEYAAFAHWLSRGRGWRVIAAIMVVATLLSAMVRTILQWKLSALAAAAVFNVCTLGLLFGLFVGWVGYRRIHDRWIAMTLEAFLGAGCVMAVFLGLSAWATGKPPFAFFDSALMRPLVAWLIVIIVVHQAIIVLVATLRYREHEAVVKRIDAETRRSDLARRLAESEIKVLRAQIEPHFLFNTLGSARQLAQKGAPDAAQLIADLIHFLRAATPLRVEAATVADEAGLIGAYLAIMHKRLGTRLRYRIDIDDAVRDAIVSPGMLITLVENAIKHGIEPAPDGGEIAVAAHRRGERWLVMTVADTGKGLAQAPPGQGLGLANIRERLALLHVSDASLELEENVPRGFVARVRMPLRLSSMHGSDARIVHSP